MWVQLLRTMADMKVMSRKNFVVPVVFHILFFSKGYALVFLSVVLLRRNCI